ncbi:MAG: universal stress protein [Acidobacteria bacterium]|nr:MAG: universal stress protein [Acidobacteriota bacterium]
MEKPKVMVALRDTDTAGTLTELACQLASLAGTSLLALHVIEVPPGLPIDVIDPIFEKPGEQVLSLARQIASNNFSMHITTKLLKARSAGEAIVGEAIDEGIELLIIGYHHDHGLIETVLGSTVQHVIHHAPCRVLVQVPARKPKAEPVVVSGEETKESLPKKKTETAKSRKFRPAPQMERGGH